MATPESGNKPTSPQSLTYNPLEHFYLPWLPRPMPKPLPTEIEVADAIPSKQPPTEAEQQKINH